MHFIISRIKDVQNYFPYLKKNIFHLQNMSITSKTIKKKTCKIMIYRFI